LTEITAVPGLGALALRLPDDGDGVLPAPELALEPPDEEGDGEVDGSSLNCCANGSLLAKRLNDAS
jgi:hypothetical protein